MKNTIRILLLLILTTSIYSQQSTILKVNVLQPGVEIETSVYKNILVSGNVGVGYAQEDLSDFGDKPFDWFITTFSNVYIKRMYNTEKRTLANKNTSYNSGNYFGVRALFFGKSFGYQKAFEKNKLNVGIGPTWGLQRSFKKIYVQFDIGVAYYIKPEDDNVISPNFRLNIGLNAKKW